jgi:hypothetical protein
MSPFITRVYTKNLITNECRNSILILILQKGDRKDPKHYREISILNTCYKTSSKILNIKLQSNSEQVMTGTQNGFRVGTSLTDPKYCLKFLIEKTEGM